MIEAAGRAMTGARNYTRAEKLADGIIHVVGLALAVVGGGALMLLSSRFTSWPTITTTAIYATSLVVALACSAAYNMWPASRVKNLLRRCDQAAIFLLIGGTYTAFLTRAVNDPLALFVLVAVWTVASIGALLKLVLPNHLDRVHLGRVHLGRVRLDRVSLVAYLTLGWSGLILLPSAMKALPSMAVCLIALGGLLYSAGVIFHMWERLRFQNAIWHAFVLVAAGCHYGAVLDCLILTRS
ncbi:hemolysin III [Rhizobiales bacterium GAS191]|nr:hemolysin III [Rhizobiales bacterium GAS191]SEC76502.1 hemolysin III [Rhizobiales bacterium GAS188]